MQIAEQNAANSQALSPSQRFYNVGMPIWETYFEHPFVRGIADGTLPIEKFRYYMIQDHKYLMQYAKVFALGVFKARDEADMRMFSNLIVATLDTENAVHQAYLAELGVTAAAIANAPMALNNKSYCNYMIAEASKGGLPEITAAVLACSWSYKVIGDYLEQSQSGAALDAENAPKSTSASTPTNANASANNPYTRWIDMYTSPGYRAANDDMIALVDRYCAGLNEDHLRYLEQIVIDCSHYEYQFWDMAWSEGTSYTAL